MVKRDLNKLMMMKALLYYLQQNQAAWQGIVPFAEAVTALETKIAEIEEIWQSTDLDQTGLVTEKNSIKSELIDEVFEIASQLFALASKTSDNILQSKVDFQKSELMAQRDGHLAINSKSIVSIARENLEAATQYNITEARLTQAEELIDRYENSLPVSRISVSERKAANAKLKELMAQSALLLKDQIKRMMTRFSKSAPDFYAGYLNASKVIDYGTRYEKPEEIANAG